uniref:Peptide/nickel transport system substrate-binding protein n=1 Tax=Candidatus Kentrum sp. FM TaxID=2126340 RepID=A0A450TPI2_9GAMM|nr:MAG: peptide/nickel transport system substrate-binding protein [Candidatus Kentron sp. FM]
MDISLLPQVENTPHVARYTPQFWHFRALPVTFGNHLATGRGIFSQPMHLPLLKDSLVVSTRDMKTWLLFICLAILLPACDSGPSTAVSEIIPKTIGFGLAASPITLDPRFATDAVSSRINRLLYDRLVDFDESFHPIPALAEWQRVTPLHYRFFLKEERRPFHNGAPLTARDVKATYDSILDENTASAHRAMLTVIERIIVMDRDTIDFHLRTSDPLFPGRLALGILPADSIARGHPFNREPIGSGPMAFLDWPHEGKLRLRRLSDGVIIAFVRVPEATVRVLKLLRGEIDLIQNDLLPELVSWLSAREDIVVRTGRGINFSYIGFHLEDAVVGDLRLRKAVAHALDREAIIRYVWGGTARVANAVLIPDHWAGHPSLPSIPFDPVRARALLAQMGYTENHRPTLVYKTSSNPFRVRLATIIQAQLQRVGIDVDLRSHDWGTFYGDIKAGRFQMYSLAWVSIKMPDIFRYAFHSTSFPPAGANRGRFAEPLADRLIDEAQATSSLTGQAKLYRELQEYVLARLPYVPLWYEDNILVMGSDITGYTLTPDGNYDGLINVRRLSSPTF